MTAVPPSRYRVVEKRRRLVVIDTLTGETATRAMPATPPRPEQVSLARRLPTGPQQTSFDGRAVLDTHSSYDLKAPRTIHLDPGATAFLGWLKIGAAVGAALFVAAVIFQPWLFALIFVVLQPVNRSRARTRITRWLDRYDTGSSAG